MRSSVEQHKTSVVTNLEDTSLEVIITTIPIMLRKILIQFERKSINGMSRQAHDNVKGPMRSSNVSTIASFVATNHPMGLH